MGCERAPHAAGPDTRVSAGQLIAVVGPGDGHPQWPGIRGGAQRFAVGAPSVRILCEPPPGAVAKPLDVAVAAALDHRPQAICLFLTEQDAAEPEMLGNVAALLVSKQILMIAMGQRVDDPRVYGQVVVDLPSAAELLGKNLGRIAAGRRSYMLVHDACAGPIAKACYERFLSAASQKIDLSMLADHDPVAEQKPATGVIEEMVDLFPNAGLLVCLDPEPWLTSGAGWERQLRTRAPGFRFATLSAAPSLWRHLGTAAFPGSAAALVGPVDGDIGYAAVALAMQALVGERKANPVRWIDCEIVTPADLRDFAQRYSRAANGLDVSRYLRGAVPVSTEPATTPASTPSSPQAQP